MALDYDGAGTGLFARLGTLIFMMDAVRTHQANLKTLLANVQAEYSSADAYMIDSLSGNIESRIGEAGGILSDVRTAATKTLVEMCFAEASVSTTNAMAKKDLTDALVWLIRQMDADSEKVNGTTVTKSSLSVGASNNGNGKFVYLFEAPNILLASTNDWPNTRTELLEARCVQDGQDGSISRGSEVFEIRGQPAYTNLDYRFPAGSGTLMRIGSSCASIDNGNRGQNIAHNTDFEDQTSNLPDRFTLSSGTAGTEFLTETVNVYRGTKAVKMAVTGATFKIRQRLGDFDGSLGRLTPDRPYVIAFAIKRDAGATGIFEISVEDSSGNIIDGGNFKLTYDVSGAPTSYGMTTATLRSPRIIPTDTYLVIETTTAIATAAAYFDEVVLAELMPIANGGPAIGIIAGSADWNADDNARYNFTNVDEGKFIRAFDRLYGMYEKGLSIPQNYSGTETIADSLIA